MSFLFGMGRAFAAKLRRLLELGGDRAVIIVSALVAMLSSSTSISKDNIVWRRRPFSFFYL